MHELTQEGTAPAVSYEVRLIERNGRPRLIWVAEDDGQRKVMLEEPAGAWRRFHAWFSRVVGLEKML